MENLSQRREKRIGSIEVGKRTDFTLFNKSPLTRLSARKPDLKVIKTWKAGQDTDTRSVTFGEIYSVPKKLGIRIKQVRERVGDELHLPSNGMLPTLECFKKQLKQNQQTENTALKREHQDLIEWQRNERASFLDNQQQGFLQQTTLSQARFRTGVKGI